MPNNYRPRLPARVLPFPEPDKGLTRVIDGDFRAEIVKRMELYHCDGLDAVRHIAMMPIDQANPYLIEVKLKAAIFLTQYKQAGQVVASGEDDVLKALNDAYHANAPRIRSIRERTIVFEGGGSSEPVTIEGNTG
jgi:type II secretory pathway component PulC